MCTLVVAAHVFADRPLVVVANRDEQLDRPSSPPFRWEAGFFAPRDDVAEGRGSASTTTACSSGSRIAISADERDVTIA